MTRAHGARSRGSGGFGRPGAGLLPVALLLAALALFPLPALAESPAAGAALPSPQAQSLPGPGRRHADPDLAVFRALNGTPGTRHWSDPLALGLSGLGSPVLLLAGAGGLAAHGSLSGDRRARDAGQILGAALLLNGAATEGLKRVFRRRRPVEALGEEGVRVVGRRAADGKSFPSGHASSAFAAAAVLTHAWPRQSGWYYGLAGGAALARVRLGAHYPSDVLAGAALGYLVGRLVVSNRSWIVGRGAEPARAGLLPGALRAAPPTLPGLRLTVRL